MKVDGIRRSALVAVAVGLLALPTAAASAQTNGSLAYQLLAEGNTQVSLAWSLLAFSDSDVAAGDGPATALIGRNDLFADNLASGALQGMGEQGAPLLLSGSDVLEAGVLAELMRLDVSLVSILGGTEAVSEEVEDDLLAAGFDVTRFFGATRTETAVDIAEEAFPDAREALIARSNDGDDPTQAFADSLAGGAWAAADGIPILFSTTGQLTQSTAEYLLGSQIRQVTILGGPAAISEDVERELEELGLDVDRVAGENRFETAVAIAAARGFGGQDESDVTLLVDGQGAQAWADGFAAAGLAARGFPLILSNSASDGLPAAAAAFFGSTRAAFAQQLDDVDLVCGATTTARQCRQAADADDLDLEPFPPPPPPSNATLDVTPTEPLGLDSSPNPDSDPNDDRTYSATGLTGDAYGITLVPADAFTVDPDDIYAFSTGADASCPGATVVTPGAVESRITQVNGVALATPGAVHVGGAEAVDGMITFVVDAAGSEDLAPVVHLAEGGCTLLETDASGLPTEPFGVGGVIVSRLPEALAGRAEVDVVATDKEADSFLGDPDVPGDNGAPDVDQAQAPSVYYYDVNDDFMLADPLCAAGVPGTLAEFEAELSAGDLVITTYEPEPSLSSAITLCDAVPGTPALNARQLSQGTVLLAVQPVDPGLQQFGPADALIIERYGAGPDGDCAGGPDAAGNGPVVAVGSFAAAGDEDTQTADVFEYTERDVPGDASVPVDWCYRARVNVAGEASADSAIAAVDVDAGVS